MVQPQASRHVLDRALAIGRDAPAAVVEHDAAAAVPGGGDHGGGFEGAASDGGVDAPQPDPRPQRARERRGIEQAPQVRAGQAQELPERAHRTRQLGGREQGPQHVVEADLRPQPGAVREHAVQRVGGGGRKKSGVDRTDARPDEHLRAFAALLQARQQSGQGADLVCAARAAAGEHYGHRRVDRVGRRARHRAVALYAPSYLAHASPRWLRAEA